MGYKIEKGIKMPEQNSKYPFKDMDIMDSFSFHIDEMFKVRSASEAYKKTNSGVKFSCKKINATEGRCWRIS